MLSVLNRFIEMVSPRQLYDGYFVIGSLFRHGWVPIVHAINIWVKKFKGTGSAYNSKHEGALKSVTMSDNIGKVWIVTARSPKRSAIKDALDSDLKFFSRNVARLDGNENLIHKMNYFISRKL